MVLFKLCFFGFRKNILCCCDWLGIITQMIWVFKPHLDVINNSFESYYLMNFKKTMFFNYDFGLLKIIIFFKLFKDKVTLIKDFELHFLNFSYLKLIS